MPIQVSCPGCQRTYNLGDALVGKQVRCKQCGNGFIVEDPEVEEVQEVANGQIVSAEDRPTRGRSGPAVNSRRRRDEDEEDDRPRRRSGYDDDDDSPIRRRIKKKSKTGLIVGLSVGGAVLIAGIVVTLVLVFGGSKFSVENFNKVKTGMSEKEVVDLLGKPTESPIEVGPAKTMIWRHNDSVYTVNLFSGSVAATASLDMAGGNIGLNMAGNPLGGDPFGGNPLGGNPIGGNPFGGNPLGGNPLGGNPVGQPRKPDWNKLRVGMSEVEVIAEFGQPTQTMDDLRGIHVIHADVTEAEAAGRPVKKLTYFKPFEMGNGFIDITIIDGKVYKFKK